jgi:ATP-dependent DNA ligase
MEAELVRELPVANGWQYEPKWDGFRGILENVSGKVNLWSRNARPLLRYFPELEDLGERLPPRSAVDGEIVIAQGGALDFDRLQMRLHPAESRVRKLAAETPAQFVVFDVLLWDKEAVHKLPLEEPRVGGEPRARGLRRGRRKAARPPVPPRFARGGREGQA